MQWTRGNIIGRGASATVHLATSAFPGEVFAVKSSELPLSEFLQKEQLILSSLHHPCIVAYKGFSVTRENEKLIYNLFMEYLAGGTLRDEIFRRGGRIKEIEAKFYTRQILKGLEYLHEQGFVHCDIKPTNILISENGVKISDFGCSKRVFPAAARVAGTPMFLPPEAARGEEQGIAGDVWALGCTVIEMVTGCSPWPNVGDPVSVLYRVGFSGGSPEIPRFLSDEGKDFLEKCLKRNPVERWSVGELLNHPFFEELNNSGFEEIKEFCSNSPMSVLDQRVWSSLEEMESFENLSPESSVSWDDVRIRRLTTFSGEVEWELEAENWIVVRECESEGEVDFVCRSMVEKSLSRLDLEKKERRVEEQSWA